MKITPKQRDAIHFIAANPGSAINEIADAAGASTSGSNDAEFLRRLIETGLVQIVVTAEADAMIDDGEL